MVGMNGNKRRFSATLIKYNIFRMYHAYNFYSFLRSDSRNGELVFQIVSVRRFQLIIIFTDKTVDIYTTAYLKSLFTYFRNVKKRELNVNQASKSLSVLTNILVYGDKNDTQLLE